MQIRGDQPYSFARALKEKGVGHKFDGIVAVTEGATTDHLDNTVLHSCSCARVEILHTINSGSEQWKAQYTQCKVRYPRRLPALPPSMMAAAYRWVGRVRVYDRYVRVSQPLLVAVAEAPLEILDRDRPLGGPGDLLEVIRHFKVSTIADLFSQQGQTLLTPPRTLHLGMQEIPLEELGLLGPLEALSV